MSDYPIETRQRSRSKTPFLRSSCDHENCEHAGEEGHQHHHHHPKKKTATVPNVQTIIEETPSDKTQYKTTTTSSTITKTSIRSKTGSPEDKLSKADFAEKLQTEYGGATTTTTAKSSSSTTTITTKSKKLIGSGPTSSTPKTSHMLESFIAQYSTAGSENSAGRRAKEITQNELNTSFERSQQKAASATKKNWKNKNTSQENGDLSDHIAYKEYKLAGEYWNKTPKTDYTYSELSPHRRELAPGVVAMPNMSRRGLENHDDRVFHMIERNPAQEEFIKKRYFSKEQQNYIENRRETQRLLYESGDELDYTRFESYGKERQTQNYGKHLKQQDESWFMRFITTIVTTITSVWATISSDNGVGNDAYARTQYYRTHNYVEQRGILGWIRHGFVSLLRYIYLGISSVLYLDTWLLQSSHANSRGRKRFLLLLLLLLPLLLFGGTYYYLHPNEPFPPKHITQITKNLIVIPQLPELPKIDLSEYVNRENYETVKNEAYVRLENLRDWTDDYFLYLKTLSQNFVDKSRQMFQKEEHFERI